MDKKIKVGILGATGMVGQWFVKLLENHPWFEVTALAASPRSAGKTYRDAVANKWAMDTGVPKSVANMTVYSVASDVRQIASNVNMVFCAIDLPKEDIRNIEESYATVGVPVVSNNSANRWTEDIPMIMPEINPEHIHIIDKQKKNRGWTTGFIATKPNCSIQSYIPLIRAWEKFKPKSLIVSTYQAVSGAGKTLQTYPEINDNVIPFIAGEEEKSEREPLKILGKVLDNKFILAERPMISANCIRIPVSNGHMVVVNTSLEENPNEQDLIEAIKNFKSPIDGLDLPSAPTPLMTYFTEDDRPQTKLDRDIYGGMGVSVGRLQKEPVLGFKCITLSHNTVRGAAGGAILTAELLVKKGYIKAQ